MGQGRGEGGAAGSSGPLLSDAEIKQIIIAVEKLALHTAQAQRAICSTVWDFFLGPFSEEPGKRGVHESKRYDVEVKKQGKGHNMGMPHPHVAMATLEGIMESAKTPMESKNVLAEVLKVLNSADQATVADIFPYWRVQEAFKTEDVSNQQVKITVAINTLTRVLIQGVTVGQIRGAIIDGLFSDGIMMVKGTAPRPKVERAVQDNLNNQQGNKK